MLEARSKLSEEERREVDEELLRVWDEFALEGPWDVRDGDGRELPFAAIRSQVGSISRLIERGAWMSCSDQRERPYGQYRSFCGGGSTADVYFELMTVMDKPEWSEEEAEMVQLVITALLRVWTMNPRSVGDCNWMWHDNWINFAQLVVKPFIQRYITVEGNELTVVSTGQTDALFTLCSTLLLQCHIHEEDDTKLPHPIQEFGREMDDRTFVDLPYYSAAPYLIPHQLPKQPWPYPPGWCGHADAEVNYTPVSERHRYQQQTLVHLLLNHYDTAKHGLSLQPDDQLTDRQRHIRRHCERHLFPCITKHLDPLVRPDLARLWLPLVQKSAVTASVVSALRETQDTGVD